MDRRSYLNLLHKVISFIVLISFLGILYTTSREMIDEALSKVRYAKSDRTFTIATFGTNFGTSSSQFAANGGCVFEPPITPTWFSVYKHRINQCYHTYTPPPPMQTSISKLLRSVSRNILGLTLHDMMRSSHDFEDVKAALNDRTDWSIELVSTSHRYILHYVSPLRDSLYSFVAASRGEPLSSLHEYSC